MIIRFIHKLSVGLIIMCLFIPPVSAMSIDELWVARYNGPGNSNDSASALAVDADGNVYVTGDSDGAHGFSDYATVKYDASGNELWVARYNGPGYSMDSASALAVDADGNVYVTGGSRGNYLLVAPGYSDYVTVKYDASGNELWVARYSGLFISNTEATALAIDAHGNVYVTGGNEGDYATVKYDASGNQRWVARYNGPGNSSDGASALALDSDGNVYVTGQSLDSSSHYDYATVKYDASGNQLWVARYSGSGISNDEATALAIDAHGNVYVTGGSEGDYATVKYDASGNQRWVARYNEPGENLFDTATALAVDASSNVYVTGTSYYFNPIGDIGVGDYSYYATIKYDSSGNELWVARYIGSGQYTDEANDLAIDADGNVYVTGKSYGSGTQTDYATVKYDASGNELWVARYNGPGNSTDSASALAVNSDGNVYVTGGSSGSGTFSDFVTIKYSQYSEPAIVLIDIMPGNNPNTINLKSEGEVPVSILTTDNFDANNVDPTFCVFAGAVPVRWNKEDIDNDGDNDMVLYLAIQELNLASDSTEATLIGKTFGGMKIIGTDSVNIVSEEKGADGSNYQSNINNKGGGG